MARGLGVVALLLAVSVAAAAASACSATAVPTGTPGEMAFRLDNKFLPLGVIGFQERGLMESPYPQHGQDDAGRRRRLGATEKCDATVVAWNISSVCSAAVGSEGAEIPHPFCEVIRLAGDIPECLCDAAQDPAVFESPISLDELRRMYKICGGMRRILRCWPLEPPSFSLPTDPAHVHAPEQTRPAPLQPEQFRPVPLQPLLSPRTTTAPMPLQPSHASLWRTFWDGIGRKIVEFVGIILVGFASLMLGWIAENWCRNNIARGQLAVENEREVEVARVREREEEAEAARERESEAARKERRAARKAARARRAARKAAKMILELELVQQKMLHAQKVFGESAASSSSSAGTSTTSSSSSPASTEYSSC